MSAAPLLVGLRCGYCRTPLASPDEAHTCKCNRCGTPLPGWRLQERFAPACAAHVASAVLVPREVARLHVVPWDGKGST